MLDNEDKRETETRYNKHGQEKRGLLVDNNNNNNNNVENANFETEEVDHNIPYYKKILKGMVTGVGFLSDAYDLFVINGVLLIIEEYYPDVAKYKSGIATSVLVGAVLGQLGFGIVADKIGRRLGFIITLALVITGSIASSLSFSLGAMNFLQCLMIWRFLLGVGVGGEYPLSATISAETSSTQKRGQTTAAVFSMQGVGSLLATIMAFLFYIMLPERLHLVWRLALAFGALPGLTMIYFRVKMEETSRFAASKNPLSVPIPSSSSPSSPLSPSLSNTRYHATSAHEDGDAANNGQEIFAERSFVDRLGTSIRSAWRSEKFTLLRQNWTRLVGTAGSWFLLDITFYANGLFSTRIIKMIGVTELKHVLIWNIYLALAALPGYWAAVFLIDRVGRKPLQLFGFAVLGGVYLTMGLIYHQLENSSALFFFMYCLTFFVTNMGANTTTYVLPSESFPTAIRATCHGISAAFGKLGAVVGSAMMTPLLDAHGLPTVLIICAIVAFCGAVHTFFFTVETLGKTLEQINNGDNEPRRGWRRFLW